MRYWYLKGGDVAGPLSAEQVSRDEEFSEDMLVCPEPNSADQAFWKTPDKYPQDFGPYLGKAAGDPSLNRNVTTEEEAAAVSAAAPEENKAQSVFEVVENQKPLETFKEEDFTFAGRNASKPAPAPAKVNKQTPDEGTIFKPRAGSGAVVMKSLSPAPQEAAAEAPQQEEAQQTQKEVSPIETFTEGSGVVRISQNGESVPRHNQPQTQQKEKSFFASMEEEQSFSEEAGNADQEPFPFGQEITTASVSELITDDGAAKQNQPAAKKEEPLIPAPRVAEAIMPTTNGKIISSSDGRLEQKRPKNNIIYLLVISMFVFTAVALFMTSFGENKPKQKQQPKDIAASEQTKDASPSAEPALQGIKEGVASPDATAAVSTPDIGHENGDIVQQDSEADKTKAQDIVKKYLLDERRGTIADFFNKNYAKAGYEVKWSVNSLYRNIYVVDFTASKVRAEPIVYMFKVDVKKGVVTSGLNSISMDLIGLK